ncbi:4-diphosphocytidyl-2-C-methyl-D-erythritol kinase [Syntrophobacter sp. SbD1]|nr:4-diphosphocytidyl-2-C-methyl-D-erythritol kinase [Syntrophobacter sp. SbD1]
MNTIHCEAVGADLTLAVSVPAKINLWLEVIRKREDGYHDISSLMLPISVFDRISIDIHPGDGPISITCDSPEIPCDDRNLAWRAADLYMKKSRKKAGMNIHLEKHIPWGAGLGGGSSDAAGVLAGLNSFFEKDVSAGDLETMALSLGADVPFFLHSRPALATGIGENLQFAEAPRYPLLLVKPPVNVPTGWVYQSLKLTKGLAQIKLKSFNEHPWQFRDLIENDLESVTVPRYPVIAEIKNWLLEQGALAASMSGSGPTVFGIFKTGQAAQDAAIIAKMNWPDSWVRAAEVL